MTAPEGTTGYPVDDLIALDRRLTGLLGKPDGWADALRAVAGSGFRRRSWDPEVPLQGLDELIAELEPAPGRPVEVTGEHGWLHHTLGVVTTTCTWPALDPDEVHTIRVWSSRSGTWRCDHWQETRARRPGP